MDIYQYETRQKPEGVATLQPGPRQRTDGTGKASGTRAPMANPKSKIRNPRSAFTLTELLVVITIIAILTALITAAAVNAMRAANRAAIKTEITEISLAFENFKNEYGAYPPNGMNSYDNNYKGNPIDVIVQKDFERIFKKAFPRNDEPRSLIAGLAGNYTSGPANHNLPGGLNAAEAVYFWLGGFSADPKYPITGPGGPSFVPANEVEVIEDRNRTYEFDLGRLGPRNANGAFDDSTDAGRFILYLDPRNNTITRRINLWHYKPAKSEQPFVYFDGSRHSPIEYDVNLANPSSTFFIYGFKKYREGFNTANAPTVQDIVYVNKDKFQILHPGLDDTWGNFNALSMADTGGNPMTFPEGPFIGDIGDTLTNFTSGPIEDEQE